MTMDAERKAELRELAKAADARFLTEALDALLDAEARADEWRANYIDSVRAMLVAAGAPEEIDAMEAEVRPAGTKPSHYIAKLKAERDRLRELGRRVVFEGLDFNWEVVPSSKLRAALIALGDALDRPCRRGGR